MDWLSQSFVDHFLLSTLVFARVCALLLAVPALTRSVPKRIKLLMVIALTAVVVPAVASGTPGVEVHQPVEWCIALLREAILGLLIGTAVQLIIVGIQFSGEFMSNSGGLQLGQSADADAIPTMAKFVGLLAVAILFAAGGHRLLIGALLDSFHEMPTGNVSLNTSMIDLLITQITVGTIAGIKLAAPVVAAMLLMNIITGLISRTLPQINVLAIGLSVNALAFLVVTALTIGSAGLIFQDELVRVTERIVDLW